MKQDYIRQIDNGERRTFSHPVELRESNNEKFFEGYAAMFNSVADLGWFTEELAPGAFDGVMNDDVRGLFNHDPDVVLGRTKAGTMQVMKDERGMKYKIKYNAADPDHVRVMEKIKRGDVSQSSFAFAIADETWERRNGKEHRIIKRLEKWFDVAPVTYPAYSDTTVAARSFQQVNKQHQPDHSAELDRMKMDMDLM